MHYEKISRRDKHGTNLIMMKQTPKEIRAEENRPGEMIYDES